MSNLEFTFEDSTAFFADVPDGASVSAARFLTLMEGETEETMEEALQEMENRGIVLDISDLPKASGTGEAAVRLRREAELVKNGTLMQALEENHPVKAALYQALLQRAPEICSLDAPAGDDDGTLGILLEDIQSRKPYEELVHEELVQTMESMLATLNDRQQQILRLHFGMEDGICHSLEEIGGMLGISKERTRQIEKQAMDKLHKIGADMGLEDFLNE